MKWSLSILLLCSVLYTSSTNLRSMVEREHTTREDPKEVLNEDTVERDERRQYSDQRTTAYFNENAPEDVVQGETVEDVVNQNVNEDEKEEEEEDHDLSDIHGTATQDVIKEELNEETMKDEGEAEFADPNSIMSIRNVDNGTCEMVVTQQQCQHIAVKMVRGALLLQIKNPNLHKFPRGCYQRLGAGFYFNPYSSTKPCSKERTCACKIDINECEMDNGGCSQICVNNVGSFECRCKPGYKLESDKKTCSDINECEVSKGGCNQICVNNAGSFECQCKPGYKMETDNKTCSDLVPDINECKVNNGGCSQLCVNNVGSFECRCKPGYKLDSDKKTCSDINECEVNNGGCDQMCYNNDGSFECYCGPAYKLQSDKKTCSRRACRKCACIHGCTMFRGKCWCMHRGKRPQREICGYESGYSGPYYSIVSSGAPRDLILELGLTPGRYHCRSNYKCDADCATNMCYPNSCYGTTLTCFTDQQRWARKQAGIVRCANYE